MERVGSRSGSLEQCAPSGSLAARGGREILDGSPHKVASKASTIMFLQLAPEAARVYDGRRPLSVRAGSDFDCRSQRSYHLEQRFVNVVSSLKVVVFHCVGKGAFRTRP